MVIFLLENQITTPKPFHAKILNYWDFLRRRKPPFYLSLYTGSQASRPVGLTLHMPTCQWRGHSGQRQNECACSVNFALRGAICDSSVNDVCLRTFYTFWDWYRYDPTGKFFNGVCSYRKVWRVSRIILGIVQLKLISIYSDSSLRVPVPFTNFIYKTHFIIGICSVHAKT